jgi:hypothetical protein
MKVYAILLQDRHCDPEVTVYADRQRAIDAARAMARQNDRHGDYEEREIDGWVFHAEYSCESDSVTVLECEVL